MKSVSDLLIIKWILTLTWIVLISPIILLNQSEVEATSSPESSTLGLLLVGVVLGPLIEEVMFRLPLLFKPIYIGLAIRLTTHILCHPTS